MLGDTSNLDDELRHFTDRYILQKFLRPGIRTSIALLRLNLINGTMDHWAIEVLYRRKDFMYINTCICDFLAIFPQESKHNLMEISKFIFVKFQQCSMN